MAKELITVKHYSDGVVKKKDGSVVTKKDGTPMEKGELVGTTEGQFPRTVAFTVFNSDVRFACKSLSSGDKVDVTFDIESREWQGRYFTEAKAWAIDVKVSGQGTMQREAPSMSTTPFHEREEKKEEDGADDLPF